MSHPAELIARIRALLESDYPPNLYRYATEAALPGTRMFPDILIFDRGGKIQCAVEVGYTRPEKLTAYRQKHHIKDVRWYDKQGNLHADVQHRSVDVRVRLEPTQEFSLYVVHDQVLCHSPECEEGDLPHETDDEFDELCALSEDVITWVVTDWCHVWFPSFCDKCGQYWLADEADAFFLQAEMSECRPLEFGKAHGARLAKSRWSEIVKRIQDALGLTPEYENGIPLVEGGSPLFRKEVVAIRGAVRDEETARPGDNPDKAAAK